MSAEKIIKKIRAFVRDCKIFIGKSPSDIRGPAIIFFPFLPFRINCGFAGLMTLLPGQNSKEEFTADEELRIIWRNVESQNLKKVLNKEITLGDYLCGAETVQSLEKAVLKLKSEKAQQYLFFQIPGTRKLSDISARMKTFLDKEEELLENNAVKFTSADLETVNSRVILLKDIYWSLKKDVLDNFDKINELAGVDEVGALNPSAFKKYRKINLLLNALDRLEVRGRDSAGLQISFSLKNDDVLKKIISALRENNLYDDYLSRTRHGDLLHGSIYVSSENPNKGEKKFNVSFTYKTFSIVGELGKNVCDLRKAIRSDRILYQFAKHETICETAFTHTRWASVGSITQENCHPVNNNRLNRIQQDFPYYRQAKAQINVVLNGDIDNYAVLRAELEKNGELIYPEITTDTKIIPLQIEKYLLAAYSLDEAFRLAVNDFEGSHAIAMTSDLEPGKIFLALKGSGQAIYVGISPDQYMFSSELYGLVEVTPDFIQMNGEESANGERGTRGQIFILDQNSPGALAGIKASHYDGTPVTLEQSNVKKAQITTRDIDRGDYPHFFLKEISQSPDSVKRTLRGKYFVSPKNESFPQVMFNLGLDIVPENVRSGLENGSIKNIVVIGHGTAAVAGFAIADILEMYLRGANIRVDARVASEMSGFLLKDDLSDTMVIPISQSGTTTDTNRAVSMARERGAYIISIVNRRQSDITVKSHGVFYTSDGRDVEMSVASTKAFYSQIIAGQILALFFAQLMKTKSNDFIASELKNLEEIPQLMVRVFEKRSEIAASVGKTISKKYWAVVGSGPNKAAADEIRIKLSELCYKTISVDIIENKKHIDLSAEPLILVCAAGNPQPVMEDIAKDVAIFKAHKAAVVVFAQEGDKRFDKIADAVIGIPAASGNLSVILNAFAGHLWGYYAACAIDEEAQIFRKFRNRLNSVMSEQTKSDYTIYDRINDVRLRYLINDFYQTFNAKRNDGAFNLLGVKTISDLALLLKYAAGKLPLEDFYHEFKSENNFISPLDLLDVTVGRAIDELTRPIDAIRHQAKTVTVGTSRKEKALTGVVFEAMGKMKFAVKNLTYKNILFISRIQPAVLTVKGYTVYDVNNLDKEGKPTDKSTINLKEKGGVALQMKSRAESSNLLMGTKKTIVSTGDIYIGKGRADGAPILVMPLLGEKGFVEKLFLLHIEYNNLLSLNEKKEVLGHRYNDIRNMVNEYNIIWQDEYLEKIPLADLFSETVENLAGRIMRYVQQVD